MSTTVDERVVEMRFDNRNFENNVRTTLSTLDRLKASLNLSGAAKGMQNIENASRKITLSGFSNAIDTVNAKFSALEIMGITALTRITNSAINAGKRITSSLTIDPVKLGYQEYETQINAVQTILANTSSKGKTIKDVNAALDELNTYADKTIYNFTEMTRNIGTFTAAGVDLDVSVQAIKGIANLAAVSGSTSQQASTAMYQLSQALASGTVKLQDWNSVVNAGMGGQVFQDSLMETARVHGVAIDKMVKQEGSFRETLKNGWLTSEVLTETLAKFTGDLNKEQLKTMGYTEEQIKEILKLGQTANDAATKVKTFTQLFDTLQEAAQSGWTQSWEIIVGDFEQAKALLTEVSDVFSGIIGESAEARNSMLEGWADLGGRTALIESFRNAFVGISSVIKPIKEGFREIFPPTTSEQLFNMTKALEKFTSYLKLNDIQSKNLKNTFKGLFAVLDIGKQAFLAIFKNVSPLVGEITGLGDGILGVTGSIGEWLVNLDETVKKTDVFNKAIQNAVNVVTNITEKISNGATKAKEKFSEFIDSLNISINVPGLETFHNLLERIQIRMGQLSEYASKVGDNIKNAFIGGTAITSLGLLSNGISGAVEIFSKFWNVLKTIGSEISKVCSKIGESIGTAFEGANFDKIFDVVNGGLFASLLFSLQQFVSGFSGIGDVTEGVTDILDNVRGCFEAYQQNLQAKTLLTIAGAIAILSGAIMLISTIDSDKLTASLGSVTVLFADLLGSLAIFSRMSGNLKGVTKAVGSMITMSIAIAILASALKKIAELDVEQLGVGLSGIAGLTATVVLAAKAMSKDTGKVMKGATNLILFATAIKILASACTDLSDLSWEEMAKGLTGVGVLMGEVSLFLNTAKFSNKAIGTATGMVILSSAIKILASACSDFASLEWEEIAKGLVSIGALLGELAIFTNLTGNAKKMVSTGTSMVLLGASMKIFASAMTDFSNMSWEEIARGLTAMAGALTEVTIAVNLMPKNLIGTGTGLIAVSAALVILANALQTMGLMSLEEIGKGIVALGSSMLILAIGLNMMNGTLAGSAAMVVAAGALAMMVPTLSLLGAMSWESIAKGLVALAGAFTVIGVAGLVLTPLVPTLLGLGGAFALLGVGVLGIGTGLMAAGAGLAAIATGLVALVGVGTAGATAIVGALTIIITGVASMIPTVVGKIGEGIVTFLQVLADSAPVFCEAIVKIVTAVIDALVETVPTIAEGIFQLIKAVLETIAKYAPDIIQAVFDILIACLQGIADNIEKVVSTAIDVVLAFLSGVSQKIPEVIQAGFDLLVSFINGMADAIEKNAPVLVEALERLILAILHAGGEVLKGGIDLFLKIGKDIMDSGFIKGLGDKINDVVKCVKGLGDKMKQSLSDRIGEFKEIAGNLIQGFIDGVNDKISSAVEAVKRIGDSAAKGLKDVLKIKSPSRVFKEIGGFTGEGFIKGLEEYGDKAKMTATTIGDSARKGLSDAISKVYERINGNVDMNPTIRPVLDLSNVESGTGKIKNMLSSTSALNLASSVKLGSGSTIQNEDSIASGKSAGNVYQFTQNNYSPKALSRIDIYRQTKNQFSAMKGVLG